MKNLNKTCSLLSAFGTTMLFAATLRASTPVVTGTYTAEDGAIYYVQQSGNVVCWTGMSVYSELPAEQQLHRGLTYTNVFRGAFTDDSTISGDWVEVSRGVTLGSGSLTLYVDTSQGSPILTKSGGSFRTASWNPHATLDDTTDIFPVFDNVYKNDGGSIHDNLKPYRDATVVYARVAADAMQFDQSVTHQPPHVNFGTPFPSPLGPIDGFLDFGHQDRSYDSFASSSDEGDGDFDFRLTIGLSDLEQDFLTTGWADLGPGPILNKFNDTTTHSTLGFTGDNAFLGAEGIMWGVPAVNNVLSLPAWAQQFNSILLNGRPIDGVLHLQNPTPDCDFPQPCPYVVPGVRLQDGIQIGKQQLVVGSYVRVSGTLILDCGHSDLGNLSDPFGPCYDEDDSDNWKHQNQEIHPISTIDIISSPLRPEDLLLSARQNLTGTWGGSDGSTYYLRQIGNTTWWLGLPRERQPMQRGTDPLSWLYPPISSLQLANALRANPALVDYSANCGPGTAIYGVLLGAAYPCWAFGNVFKGTITAQPDGTSLIQGDWVGVPQSASPGNVGTSQTFTLDGKRKMIQPVSGVATIFPATLLKLYEPEDVTPPSSGLSIGTPQYNSASNQIFVSGATPLTLSATDQDSGVQNLWYREFLQGTTPPSSTPVVGSVAFIPFSGSDGLYEIDSYATDNAGNDESAHTAQLYLDKTPPAIGISQPAAKQYTHNASLTISVSINDGPGAGVKSSTLTLDTTPVINNQTISLLNSLSLGSHTFSVVSFDNVNNVSTMSVTFTIIVTAQSIKDDVTQFVSAGKITVDTGAPLLGVLNSAARARAAGDCATAANLDQTFIKQVTTLSGKKIDPTAAQIMIADARYLLAHCP